MKIEKKLLEKSIIELILEDGTENIAKSRKSALAHLEKTAEIKGFRKGAKIPESILVRQFGEEYITNLTVEFGIDTLYKAALKKEKIIPVAQAEIKEVISQSPLKIRVHIEVFPEIEIDAKYKDIKLERETIKVSAAEVKNALTEIETKFTTFEEVTDKRSKLKMGDRATIDTQGFEDGKALENTNMQDYPLVLGSDILVPGFEEDMVGAKIGDELELDVNFPDDYHNEDFKGKKTKFKVTIKKFEKSVKPEFTEEFIEQLRGQKLDLDGFKALIKEEIKDTKESNARIEEEQKLIEELVKVTKLELGEKMIAQKIEQVFGEIKQNLAGQNVKMADYLESLKLSEEDYKKQHVTESAIKRLQGELILHKLSEMENAEVTDKEMEKEISIILKKFGSKDVLKRLEELYVPGNKYYEELKQRMKYKKLIDNFFVTKK
ncbi:MAG: trigger factor [Candidatus Gracilibacteria bacterium]|nr:trigger factor [Candidatus Gracilibacteria bacterium]